MTINDFKAIPTDLDIELLDVTCAVINKYAGTQSIPPEYDDIKIEYIGTLTPYTLTIQLDTK